MSARPSEENSNNSTLKYFRLFLFTSPLGNLWNYTHGVTRIFEELQKTY